jgi:hypothetical protein
MGPIIEINWISLLEGLVILVVIVGIGILVTKAVVTNSKELRDRAV